MFAQRLGGRMKQLVGVVFIATLAIGAICGHGQEEKSGRPNFVFILADDWGWGDLGCYGHETLKTPHLDRMAREGILFSQFYVNAPVCSPSRAGIMTGRFPGRFGIHAHLASLERNAERDMPNWLDPGVTTLTKLLQDSGYRTGHFGKWHLGGGRPAENQQETPQEAPAVTAYGIDECRIYNGNGPDFSDFDKFVPRSSEVIIDETLRFISESKDRPFYVQAWLKDTHAILRPTDKQKEPYQALGGALETYYGVVTDADRHIGRLLTRLGELGLDQNTVVVFSSDNGPEDIHIKTVSHSGVGSAGPFRGRKRSLYEGGVRTPFIVRWPSHIPAGKVDQDSVLSGVDMLPTICSLAGVRVPQELNLDGEDRSEVLLGNPQPRQHPLLWEFRFAVVGHVLHKSPVLAIRDGDWKLLMNPDRSRIELYDIPRDPSELSNLAEQNPDVVERLSQQVLEWSRTLPPGRSDIGAGNNGYPWPEGS